MHCGGEDRDRWQSSTTRSGTARARPRRGDVDPAFSAQRISGAAATSSAGASRRSARPPPTPDPIDPPPIGSFSLLDSGHRPRPPRSLPADGLRPLAPARRDPAHGARVRRAADRAGRRRARAQGRVPPRDHPRGGRPGPPRRAVPRGDRRHRARLAGLRDHRRGAQPCERQRRDHRQRPHEPRLQPDLAGRDRCAEGALPATDGIRRGDRRLRPHRARCRQRLTRHEDARSSRWRRVGAQRQQALHHQRGRGRHVHRHRGDRAGAGEREDQRLHPRGRYAGLQHRPHGGEDGPPCQQHRRADLRGRADPRSRTSSARRARATSCS